LGRWRIGSIRDGNREEVEEIAGAKEWDRGEEASTGGDEGWGRTME
jgi:hypothetical protein